jgi:drug/metabolite transporter (DMT)-like permease
MSSNEFRENQALGYLYIFLGIFLFATIEITAKLITSFSKFQQHFFRIILGVLIIALMIYFRRDKIQPIKYIKNYWKLVLCAGFVWLSIASPIFFFALNLTRASSAALLLASNPILVALGSMLLLGEKKTLIKFIAIILGFAGAFIVISELQFTKFDIKGIVGNFLAFLSVFGYAAYTLISIHVIDKDMNIDKNEIDPRRKYDLSLMFNFWGFLFGALFFSPVFFLDITIINPIKSVSFIDLFLLLYLGIMTTGVAYILYTLGINQVEASRGVLFFYSKPIIAMILAWLILQEPLTIYFIIGFCLIFVAVVISEWEKSRLAKRKTSKT